MLSKRLKEIAKLVKRNKVVFDVGSDHALLPCFLVLNDICFKAYAADINEGPLNHGIENIIRYHLEDKVIPILSDGLENAPDDVQVVIISGMGFYTIKHILENADLSKYENIIVQSNTDVDKLRKYISNNNYTIEEEVIIYDDFYYQIISFNTNYHDKYDDLQIEFGPLLLENKDESFINYLIDYKNRLEDINERANREEYKNIINKINKILYN